MTLPKKRLSQDLPDDLPPHAKRKTSAADLFDKRLEEYARLASAVDVLETDSRRRQLQRLLRQNATSSDIFLPSAPPLPSDINLRYFSAAWARAPPSIATPCAPTQDEVVLPLVQVQGSIPHPRLLPLAPFKSMGDPLETAAAAGAGSSRNSSVMLSTLLPRQEPAPSLADSRVTKSPRDPGDIKGPRDHKTSSLPDPEGRDECYVGERCPTTGLRHGHGTMEYPNGCRYVGCFSQGRRHGFGKVWYPGNRGLYTGHWRQNKKHGRGTMHYSNKDVYEGRWEDDMPHGEGKLTMTQRGEAYNGGFFKKMKHGRGVYRLSNGDVYKGGWKDDVRHGAGVLISASGEVEKRMYYEGMLIHRN